MLESIKIKYKMKPLGLFGSECVCLSACEHGDPVWNAWF